MWYTKNVWDFHLCMKGVGSPVVYLTVFIIDLSLQLRHYLYVPSAHISDYIIFSAIQHYSEGNNS